MSLERGGGEGLHPTPYRQSPPQITLDQCVINGASFVEYRGRRNNIKVPSANNPQLSQVFSCRSEYSSARFAYHQAFMFLTSALAVRPASFLFFPFLF